MGMQTTLTTKLKLVTTPEQFCQLRLTQLAYRDALNQASQHAFVHGKTSNSQRLHRDLYLETRARYGLSSQMACSVFRQVGATYKGLWTKWYKNVEARKAGWTRKRFKGLDQPPHSVSPTLTYVFGRDYTFKATGEVSVLTLAGRVALPYQGYTRHLAWLQHGTQIGGAKLWYDRGKQRFYLLVSLTIVTPDPTPVALSEVVGVDLGQRYLATLTTEDDHIQFYSGKQVRAKADHYARVQQRLQRKGTWLRHSATDRHGPADETVQAEHQPHHRQADPGHPSQESHRPGRLDWHSRAKEAAHPSPQGQAVGPGFPQSPQGESTCLEVGVCGTPRTADLQSGALWQLLHQRGCRLHEPVLSALWLHEQTEPSPARVALCLPALPVYPPCRPRRCQEYLLANACHPAGLDGNGAIVTCP